MENKTLHFYANSVQTPDSKAINRKVLSKREKALHRQKKKKNLFIYIIHLITKDVTINIENNKRKFIIRYFSSYSTRSSKTPKK